MSILILKATLSNGSSTSKIYVLDSRYSKVTLIRPPEIVK